jgi:hypothetical protein
MDRGRGLDGGRSFAAGGEGGDVSLGEEALLAVGVAAPGQQAATHVGVDGSPLDAQPAGDVLGCQQSFPSHVDMLTR